MANRQKYTRAAIGHLCAHYGREKDKEGNYYKFGNQDIDPTKTHLNYNLAALDQPLNQVEFIRKRMEELKCLKRKDVNVMISWVVTLPKEMNDRSEEEKRKFFEKVYEFLKERYGVENVISAYVHMDEGQPHTHFAFTPVCYDKKKETYKFNAKLVGSRKDLNTFHDDLDKQLTKEMGYTTGVRNGATEINMSIKELKEVQKRMNEIDKQLSQIAQERPVKGILGYKTGDIDKLVLQNELLEKKALLSLQKQSAAEKARHGVESELKKIKTSSSVKKRNELIKQVTELNVALDQEKERNINLQFKNKSLEIENEELKTTIKSLNNELSWYQSFFDQVINFLKQCKESFVERFKEFLEPSYSEAVQDTLDRISVPLKGYYDLATQIDSLETDKGLYKLFKADKEELYFVTDENKNVLKRLEVCPDLEKIVDRLEKAMNRSMGMGRGM